MSTGEVESVVLTIRRDGDILDKIKTTEFRQHILKIGSDRLNVKENKHAEGRMHRRAHSASLFIYM